MPSFITAHTAQANTVAITTPTFGDTIFVFAHRDGSVTPPTMPAGYHRIDQSGANLNSAIVAFKVSDGTETSIGTWTNATSVAAAIYRDADPGVPAGGFIAGGASSASMAYNGLTMQVTGGTSWVLGFGAHTTATNVGTNAPTGMTARSSTTDVAVFDTAGGVSSWSTQSAAVSASSGWRTYTVELVAKAARVDVDQIVWHCASQSNCNYETGNLFKIPCANPTISGNTLVLQLTYAQRSGRTLVITDDKGNTWPAASLSADDSGGDLTCAIFVLPNPIAGTSLITLTFDVVSTITAISVANPTQVTTSGAHGLATGQIALIVGSNSTPTLDGDDRTVTVVDATHYTIPINVTVSGNAGTSYEGVEAVQWNLTELWGIAHTTPVDDTTSNRGSTPDVSAGTGIVTTVANDLILTYSMMAGWGTAMVGATVQGFRAQEGYRLLSADRWIGIVSQIGLRASTGAFTPRFYVACTGSSGPESMQTLAVALKTDATKGAQSTVTPRVTGITKVRVVNGTFLPVPFPTIGNLTVMAGSSTPSQTSIDALKDSSNAYAAYTRLVPGGVPQLVYLPNASPHQTNVVYCSNSTDGLLHAVLYDIAGAHTSPYDTDATYVRGSSITGPGNITPAPTIVTAQANELIIASLNCFTGPPDTASAPTGIVFDCGYYLNMSDLTPMDSGDGYAHVNMAAAGSTFLTWHLIGVTSSDVMAHAVAFKGAATGSTLTPSQAAAVLTGRGTALGFTINLPTEP